MKKLKLSLCALSLALSSGCNHKVFSLAGSLDTSGVVAQCGALTSLQAVIPLKNEVDHLVEESLKTEDTDELSALADQISADTTQLQKLVTPQFSDGVYPAVYRFKIQDEFLQGGLIPKLEKFSIMGVSAFDSEISVEANPPTTDIVVKRSISLLEMCVFTGTVQGLFQVVDPQGKAQFYYRLFVNELK